MDDSYIIGKTKKTFRLSEFPVLSSGEKIAIFFTGGFQSYLIAYIAKQLYGIENIIFIFLGMDEYSNFKTNKTKYENARKNFLDGVKRIGGIHVMEIDQVDNNEHELASYALAKMLFAKFGNVKYVFAGYRNIHEESIQMLQDSGWNKGQITSDRLIEYVKNNSEKYKELSYYLENLDGVIHFTNKFVSFESILHHFNVCVRPLRNLDAAEIIELYGKMNLLGELYKTTSCELTENDKHCGKCKNCQQRKYAFSQSNITDLTEYSFN